MRLLKVAVGLPELHVTVLKDGIQRLANDFQENIVNGVV
jgi:hypothetical protein